MTDLRKVMQQALEALDCIYSPLHVREINKVGAAITDLRAALAQPDVAEGYVLVPVGALQRWQAAFAEELGAWDIDPPLHHVLLSHDEIDAMLAAAPKGIIK